MDGFSVSLAAAGDGGITLALSGHVDSANAGAVEQAIATLRNGDPQGAVTLDVSGLDYISSAGLRVLMRLSKGERRALTVINCSPDVYDVLDMTGFTELMDVRRRLREVSVEGLEPIGVGATAKVYRIDPETIVKVFNPNVGTFMIERENERSRAAFLAGVPTAIAYDTVRVGDRYGAVFELIDAQDLITVMLNDREHAVGHVRDFAREVRAIHELEADTTRFADLKQQALERVSLLEGVVATHDEVLKLRKVYEAVPDRTTFVHGDCHPGNVMVQNGEVIFIDVAGSGYGHPIFDMMSMYLLFFVSSRDETRRKGSKYSEGFTAEECATFWRAFLSTVLDTDDEDRLRLAERQIGAFANCRVLGAAISLPGLFSPERLEGMKRMALAYVDAGIEPLCF